MKLYTREQMIEAFNYGQTLKGFDWIGDMIDSLEAIELPTDEEIEKYVKSTGYYGHCTPEYHEGIEEGAKWVIEKINNLNK